MDYTKAEAIELCALNEAAYVLANTGSCELPAGFGTPVPIRMPEDGRPFFLRHDPLDIWGFAVFTNGVLDIVFRGTQITSGVRFAQEWAEDALSLPLRAFGAGCVHLGFYGAWMALRSAAAAACLAAAGGETVRRRRITGHSLGAAIATLCWADSGGDLMTFCCPRVGDPAFATSLWLGKTVRVVNAPDLVPRVPIDPPFRHGGFEVKVKGPGSVFDPRLSHALTSVIAGINSDL